MEYEANIFASQISLPDDEILEYIENGYDIQQIAQMCIRDSNRFVPFHRTKGQFFWFEISLILDTPIPCLLYTSRCV